MRVRADGASVLEETVRQGDVLTDEQRVIFFAEVLDEDDFERRKRKAEEDERVRRRRRARTVRERFEKFYDDDWDDEDDEIDRVERFEAGTNDAGV